MAGYMYDYLDTVVPDYAVLLNVTPQNVLVEDGYINQTVHRGDDGSDEIIIHSGARLFTVSLTWERLEKVDLDTIYDTYYDPTKADGIARTFLWSQDKDPHVYVVRFDSRFKKNFHPAIDGLATLKLNIKGRA